MGRWRNQIHELCRRWGLLQAVEDARFLALATKSYLPNLKTRRANPGFAFPPMSLVFEMSGQVRLAGFQEADRGARKVVECVREYLQTPSGEKAILDWGCGPAFVTRHLPGMLGGEWRVMGSDYAGRMVAWCRENIREAEFFRNELNPPLPLGDASLDAAFGLSVVTHLGDRTIREWLAEFHRVLKPGGIFFFTTLGEWCVDEILSEAEGKQLRDQGWVTRRGVDEGRKMFLAYHSPGYIRGLVEGKWSVCRHEPRGMPGSGQDVWILRKESVS